MTTISKAIELFLEDLRETKSTSTYKNYSSDLVGSSGFITILTDPYMPASRLSEDLAVQYLQMLLDNGASVATRQRKAAAVRDFYKFLAIQGITDISITKTNLRIKQEKVLNGKKERVEVPKEKIRRVLNFVKMIKPLQVEILRNQAFLFVLAETGLRVGYVCELRTGDINTKTRSVLIPGKEGAKKRIYFGSTSWKLLSNYLKCRGITAGAESVPVFTRHDKHAPKIPKPITEETARSIVREFSMAALGSAYDSNITSHKFRSFYK